MDGLNGYKALYRGKWRDVRSETSYGAQQIAALLFKAKKASEVRVFLCERKDGSQVTHVADF